MKLFFNVFLLLFLASHAVGQPLPDPVHIRVDDKNIGNDIGLTFEKCSFIPLETSKDCLFGRVAYAEKYGDTFFLTNIRDGLLMSFDIEGKFIANYIRIGKGPGELVDPISYMIDFENDDVVVCSWDKKSNLHYAINGTFKKEVPCRIHNEGMVRLDEETVVYYSGNLHNVFDGVVDYSYLIYANDNSEITYKGIVNQTVKSSRYVMYQCFPRYKNKIYFKHPYPDTIYLIDKSGAQPKYIMDFGKDQIDWSKIDVELSARMNLQIRGQNRATVGQKFFEFENWIFFDFNLGSDWYYALYNKSSRKVELFEPKSMINSKAGTFGKVVGATEKGLICLLEPLDLLYPDSPTSMPSDLKSNKELESIVSNLKETDNPVIMICEFK